MPITSNYQFNSIRRPRLLFISSRNFLWLLFESSYHLRAHLLNSVRKMKKSTALRKVE